MKPNETIQFIPTYLEEGGDIYDRLNREIAKQGGITVSRDKMTMLEDPGIRHRKDILNQKGLIYKTAQGALAFNALVSTLAVFETLKPMHSTVDQYTSQIAAVGASWLACSLGLKAMHKIKSRVNVWRLDRSLKEAYKDLQQGVKPKLLDNAERCGKFFWPLIWAGSGVVGLQIGTLIHDTLKGINHASIPLQLFNPSKTLESLNKVANAGLNILSGNMDSPALTLAAYGCGGLALGIVTGLRLTIFSRTNGVIQDLRENVATLASDNLGEPGGRNAVVNNTRPTWMGVSTREEPLWRKLAQSRMETIGNPVNSSEENEATIKNPEKQNSTKNKQEYTP